MQREGIENVKAALGNSKSVAEGHESAKKRGETLAKHSSQQGRTDVLVRDE